MHLAWTHALGCRSGCAGHVRHSRTYKPAVAAKIIRVWSGCQSARCQTLDVAQTDYFLRSTLATACTRERSMVRTLSAAAVQKIRPVMQWWPLQLPSAFWTLSTLVVIDLSHFSQSAPPLWKRLSPM